MSNTDQKQAEIHALKLAIRTAISADGSTYQSTFLHGENVKNVAEANKGKAVFTDAARAVFLELKPSTNAFDEENQNKQEKRKHLVVGLINARCNLSQIIEPQEAAILGDNLNLSKLWFLIPAFAGSPEHINRLGSSSEIEKCSSRAIGVYAQDFEQLLNVPTIKNPSVPVEQFAPLFRTYAAVKEMPLGVSMTMGLVRGAYDHLEKNKADPKKFEGAQKYINLVIKAAEHYDAFKVADALRQTIQTFKADQEFRAMPETHPSSP